MTTRIDQAFAAMMAADSSGDAARLAYYGAVADAELLLLLEREAESGVLTPRVFPLSDGPFVLAFDDDAHLAGFAAGPAPYAALPGRVIAARLAGQRVGLAINLGAASAMVLPPEAMDWLAGLLDAEVAGDVQENPVALVTPDNPPAALLAALQDRIGRAGQADAMLAMAAYADGRRGLLLAFLDAPDGSAAALATMAREALLFSGVEGLTLDVAFLRSDQTPARQMVATGLRLFRAPALAPAAAPRSLPPGMDKTKPPRLR